MQNKFKMKITFLWMANPGISGLYMLTGIYIGKPGQLRKQEYNILRGMCLLIWITLVGTAISIQLPRIRHSVRPSVRPSVLVRHKNDGPLLF